MRRLVLPAVLLLAACSGAGDADGGDATGTTAATSTTATTVPGADAPRTSVVTGGPPTTPAVDEGPAAAPGVDGVELSLRQLSSGSAQLTITGTLTNPEGGQSVLVAGLRSRCGEDVSPLLSAGGDAVGTVAPGAAAPLEVRAILHADEVACEGAERVLEVRLAVAAIPEGAEAPPEAVVDLGPVPSLDGVVGPLDAAVLSPDGLCASLDRDALADFLRVPVDTVEVHRLACVARSPETPEGRRFVLLEAYVDAGPVTPMHPAAFGCVDALVASSAATDVVTCHRGDRSSVAVLALPDVVLAVSSQRATASHAAVNLLQVVRPALDALRG